MGEKLPAVEIGRKATMEMIGRFTKQDIRELCPSLRISSVEGSLRKLVESGELKKIVLEDQPNISAPGKIPLIKSNPLNTRS